MDKTFAALLEEAFLRSEKLEVVDKSQHLFELGLQVRVSHTVTELHFAGDPTHR